MDRLHPVEFMPFVGADCDEGPDPSRISNREPSSWLEVVQSKNLVDWSAQGERRVPGRISILVPTYEDWRFTLRCLDSIVACADEEDIEVVVLDNASRRSVSAILAAVARPTPASTTSANP